MKSIALSIGLMLTLSPGINAAEPAWSLEQAEERIRQHRMSDAGERTPWPLSMAGQSGGSELIFQKGAGRCRVILLR